MSGTSVGINPPPTFVSPWRGSPGGIKPGSNCIGSGGGLPVDIGSFISGAEKPPGLASLAILSLSFDNSSASGPRTIPAGVSLTSLPNLLIIPGVAAKAPIANRGNSCVTSPIGALPKPMSGDFIGGMTLNESKSSRVLAPA